MAIAWPRKPSDVHETSSLDSNETRLRARRGGARMERRHTDYYRGAVGELPRCRHEDFRGRPPRVLHAIRTHAQARPSWPSPGDGMVDATGIQLASLTIGPVARSSKRSIAG